MLDIKEAAAAFMAERQKTFSHDRRLTIGASEIGLCALRIWKEKKLGPAHYDKTYKPADGAAFRGDIIEDQFTVAVVRHAIAKQLPGAELRWAGPGQQHTLQAPQWKLSATPDGIIINAPKNALEKYGVSDILGTSLAVEMKSFDPRIGDDKLPKQTHLDQVNVQLGLLRKEGNVTPAWGLLVYVNSSFLDDVRVFVVPYDKLKFENQIRRAMFIMAQNSPVHLRPEGKIGGEVECRYCPFAKSCLGYVPKVPTVAKDFDRLKPIVQATLRSRVDKLDELRRRVKGTKEKEESLLADIREILVAGGTKRVAGQLHDGRGFKVTWEKMIGRETIDAEKVEAFVAQHGYELNDFKKRGNDTERLTITVQPLATVDALNADIWKAEQAKIEDTAMPEQTKEPEPVL